MLAARWEAERGAIVTSAQEAPATPQRLSPRDAAVPAGERSGQPETDFASYEVVQSSAPEVRIIAPCRKALLAQWRKKKY
jgi:hypothetical protein